MGIVSSRLHEGCLALKALYLEIQESNGAFTAVQSRISRNPGFPVTNPTSSFWLRDPPYPELVDVQSVSLPQKVDIVIIGSGITGTSVARTILTQCEALGIQKKVVMLEARQVCSGATGRNGGHMKVSPYEAFSIAKKRFGAERARAIVEFQRRHLPLLLALVKAEGLEVSEAREVDTVDFFTDEEMWREALRMLKELEDGMPDVARELKVWNGDETREKFHASSHVIGAISYRSGALWPYRLVTSILSFLLSTYCSTFSIETNTPVQSISVGSDAEAPFNIHTLRGSINASHVIHATNGHSASLIPGILGKLFPIRLHMTAQRPGRSFPSLGGNTSWSFIHQKGSLEYMIQRPGNPDTANNNGLGGELMLCGALVQSGGRGLDEIGIASDDATNFGIGTYLGGLLPMVFGPKNWGADGEGGRMKDMWTGIMGFTVDLLPLVGRLEPSLTRRKVPQRTETQSRDASKSVSPAEWIAAGFNGEGMVHAWLCGMAVGLMVLGREKASLEPAAGCPGGKVVEWLPAEFLVSKKRLDRGSIYDLASLI